MSYIQMHWKAVIQRVWRGISMPRSTTADIHLQDGMMLNSEMHVEAVIGRGWRFICRTISRNTAMP